MKKTFIFSVFAVCVLASTAMVATAATLPDSYKTATQVVNFQGIRSFSCDANGVYAKNVNGSTRAFFSTTLCAKVVLRTEFTLFPNGVYYKAPDFTQCTSGLTAFPWNNATPEYVTDPGCTAYQAIANKAVQ
jgi:hypothetical protein